METETTEMSDAEVRYRWQRIYDFFWTNLLLPEPPDEAQGSNKTEQTDTQTKGQDNDHQEL